MHTFTCSSVLQHLLHNRSKLHSIFTFVFFLGILSAINLPVFAQGTITGSFVGQITNSRTGAGIPDAKITFTNLDTGFFQVTRTDKDGQFSRSGFLPGNYEIQAEATGYKTIKSKSQGLFATQSNRVVPVPIRLEEQAIQMDPVAGVEPTPSPVSTPNNQTGIPLEDAAAIDLNTTRLGRFSESEVRNLPLGGTTLTRTFDELALLVPGVALPPQAIGNSVGPGIGGGVGTSGQFSVNGLRSRANNFTVDGSDNNDEDIGVRRQGFFSLVPQPIESIQEFSIITLLAPAEFGRNLGAQVNAISKRGANRFNGTFYGLFNSSKLNSRNFFDNTDGNTSTDLRTIQFANYSNEVPVVFLGNNGEVIGERSRISNNAGEKDPLTLLQGGFAVGGRIIRDKMFFFVSGEGQLLNATKETHFAVPTIQQRGFVNTGATGLQQCQAGFNLQGNCIQNFVPGFPTSIGGDAVFSLFPFPNDPRGIYGQNTYTQTLSSDARGRIFSGRYDWNIFEINGNQQTFTARYNNTDDRRDLTDVGGALFSAIRPLVRTDNFSSYITGGLTESGNIINELRLSFGRTSLKFEELRDTTGFLVPSNRFRDTPFILNAPFFANNTLPVNCNTSGCNTINNVIYSTVTGMPTTEDTQLGPIGQLVIAGFSPVGVDVFNFPQQRINNTFQIADTLRWRINGSHNLSIGTDIRLVYLDSDLPRNSRPLVTFNGSPDYFELCATQRSLCPTSNLPQNACVGRFCTGVDLASGGAATGFFQTLVLPGQDARINLSYNQINLFAQDEWRINPKLLLNFGLRYEYNTTPKEADRKIEDTFATSLPSTVSSLSNFIDGRDKIYEADSNNFAPRFGISAALTDSTVVRGGFGVYYDQILGAVVSQSRNVFPTFSTLNFGGGNTRSPISNQLLDFSLFNPTRGFIGQLPIIQQGTINTLNPAISQTAFLNAILNANESFPFYNFNSSNARIAGSAFGATLPQRNLSTPFSYQYSIGIEQRLYQDTFLSVAYVGTKGRDLLRFTTPNLGNNYVVGVDNINLSSDGELIVSGTTFDPVANRVNGFYNGRPVPLIGPINQFETTGQSQYDSLQLELRGRLKANFQYRTSYVYGKVSDDVSDVFDLAGASALPQNSLTFDGEYAPANFDVRHRFTYNFVYDAPLFEDQNSFVKYLFGGWQITGTGKASSGQPFTVNSIFDVNLDGNLTDRLNNAEGIIQSNDRRRRLLINGDTQSLLAPIGQDGSVRRNSFRAPSIVELDLSFAKRFRLMESQFLQFRVDIFNIINRANFGIPVRFLEAPSFGEAVDTVTPGRRVQLGLKYNF